MTIRCPYCGSARLVWDDYNGYLVCASCGAIIEPLFDEGESNFYAAHQPIRLPRRINTSAPLSIKKKDSANEQCTNDYIDSLASIIINFLNSRTYSSRIERALSYYAAALAVGMRKRDALSLAAARSNISTKYLNKKLRVLRVEVREAIKRLGEYVAERRRDASRTVGPSQVG